MPLFVLFLKKTAIPFHREFRSREQVETMRGQAGDPSDSRAWEQVEAFFSAGGSRLHVLGLPLGKGDAFRAMLGSDKGVGKRTGLQAVKDWCEKADLLVIPQATELLSVEDYKHFCQRVFDLTGPEFGMLVLTDLPKAYGVDQAETFSRDLFCADAAIFHPWVLVSGKAVPPSVILSAWIQRADAEIGIQEMAADLPLPVGLKPIIETSATVRARLLESRINTFLVHCDQTLVWGGYTLADKADWKSRLIPIRRSCVKLQQAAEQICEPFVLEAAGEELPVWVENSLQNFLRSIRKIFRRDIQQPFTTSVKVVAQEGEDKLLVALSYSLPHSLERFSFSFVA